MNQIVDTNILARLLLQDDATQAQRVADYLERCSSRGDTLLVSDVVLAELFWLLAKKGLPKEQILRSAIELLNNELFEFDDHERTAMALGYWAESQVSFVDAYLAARANHSGVDVVLSFDSDFKRLPVHWVQP